MTNIMGHNPKATPSKVAVNASIKLIFQNIMAKIKVKTKTIGHAFCAGVLNTPNATIKQTIGIMAIKNNK